MSIFFFLTKSTRLQKSTCIFQTEVWFSKLSPCKQTHYPVPVVLWLADGPFPTITTSTIMANKFIICVPQHKFVLRAVWSERFASEYFAFSWHLFITHPACKGFNCHRTVPLPRVTLTHPAWWHIFQLDQTTGRNFHESASVSDSTHNQGDWREREEERAKEENKTLKLLATMEEEKVPRFHIFAQVDYSGLFSGFAACLLAALSCTYMRIQTYTHLTVPPACSGSVECTSMQSLVPQARVFSCCFLFSFYPPPALWISAE